MNSLRLLFRKPFFKHLLFWLMVYSFYVVSDNIYFDSTGRLLFKKFLNLIQQILTAYGVIYIIIPQFKKNKLGAVLLLLGLLISMNLLFVLQEILFSPLNNGSCYYRFKVEYGHLSFLEQVYSFKANFFYLSWLYLQPLLFLLGFQFYEKQKNISEINEQKKTAELSALKHQLNPHFLFNTLNNLYALSVEKSDRAPKVIERLSAILDYMLYRCNDNYVPLKKEIELIENYLALEKIRYGKRAIISFKNEVIKEVKIAPLILLTFIENAFKHGVSQELKKTEITISIKLEKQYIVFFISNTKPLINIDKNKNTLGLKNVKHQLDLLYGINYDLKIEDKSNYYTVILKLKSF